jgi:anti-sigma regulatory factor (Ser/Thr protein kinase)
MIASQLLISVSDQSGVGESRRQINSLAEEAGFDEPTRGKAAIIATELATNLVRYAQRGEMLLRWVAGHGKKWIEVLAIDRGPGMRDVERCLEDGFSSGGTSGTGLGAVRRLATEFDLYSAPATGTVVLARLHEKPPGLGPASPFRWGVINRPAPHETECGDVWRIAERPGELAITIADGLGHGPLAAAAAQEGASAFDADPFASPSSILQTSDRRMRGTRGAAMAAARFTAVGGLLKYAGVGNIAARLGGCNGEPGRGLVSHNGTVGVQIHKIQEFDYTCPPQGLFVMHSDGLQSRWTLEPYPGLMFRHPAVIAGVLYRDFTRAHDDLTVAVVRVSLT